MIILRLLLFICFSLFLPNIVVARDDSSDGDKKLVTELISLKKRQAGLSIFSLVKKFRLQDRIRTQEELLRSGQKKIFPMSRFEKGMFIFEAIPLLFWQFLILILWCYLLYYFLFRRERKGFYAALLLLVSLGITVSLTYAAALIHRPTAVLVKKTELHSGPGGEYPAVGGQLQQGTSVVCLVERDGFVKVEVFNRKGWLSTDLLVFI